LLVMSTSGAGYDPVDVPACTAAGILVVNQSGANAEAVAEHTIAMLLSLTKNIMQTDRSLRKERGIDRDAVEGRNAHARTVGIIGLGEVGRRVARLCGTGLEMRVLAYDPYLTEAECQARRANPVALDTLLAQADFVTIHCPLSAETRGMIGPRELALMPPHAFLINTARGGIVDEAPPAAPLKTHKTAGPGAHVGTVAPPPLEHPLRPSDNVIAPYPPAGVTEDSRHTMAQWNAEQLVQIFQGQYPPRL